MSIVRSLTVSSSLFVALALLTAGCAVNPGKEPVEADVSTAALTMRLQAIGANQPHAVTFNGATKWFGFSFHGVAGNKVSVYAAGKTGNVDTVVYLYRVSRTTGRTTGTALAVNDDTARTDWTSLQTNSSIDGIALPETRDYAILVRAYDPTNRGVAEVWWSNDAPNFPADGASKPLAFDGVAAQELPVSADVHALVASAGSSLLSVARIQVAPATLGAVVTDSARFAKFGHDVMYYGGDTPAFGSTVNFHANAIVGSIATADATKTLQDQTRDASNPANAIVMTTEQQLIASMLGDGDFATSRVNVYKVHYDNGDDTNADAILAVDLATGEARAVMVVNPP